MKESEGIKDKAEIFRHPAILPSPCQAHLTLNTLDRQSYGNLGKKE